MRLARYRNPEHQKEDGMGFFKSTRKTSKGTRPKTQRELTRDATKPARKATPHTKVFGRKTKAK
jgi:hypothetical protein